MEGPHHLEEVFSRSSEAFTNRDELGVGSIQSVGQEEKAKCEEAEKRKKGFPFQIVGMGSEQKGEGGIQGIAWRLCRVCGGDPEEPSLPRVKKIRDVAEQAGGNQI